jgi:FecR protein
MPMKCVYGFLILTLVVGLVAWPAAGQDSGKAKAESPKAADTAKTTEKPAETPKQDTAAKPAETKKADTAKTDAAKTDTATAADSDTPAVPTVTCKVKSAEGSVEWRPNETAEWQILDAGDSVPLGADICTGFRAKCLLEFADESSVVEVQPMTILRIGEFEKKGKKVRTRVYLMQGSTRTVVEKSRFESDFAIVTPEVTLAVRGTKVIDCRQFSDKGPIIRLSQAGAIKVTNNRNRRSRNLRPRDMVKRGLAQSIRNVTFGSKIKIFDKKGGITKNEQFSIMNRPQMHMGTPNRNAPNGKNKVGGGNAQKRSRIIADLRRSLLIVPIIHEWECE